MESILTDVEVRLIGCLIEKEMTTPLSYPLTLNGLVTASNQKSNRFPTVSYDEELVLRKLDELRDKRLVETVFPGGSRVAKYKHNFSYEYGLNAKLQALMAVMMLRGPQTVGELRTRTERMARFENLESVTEHLEELITREEGALVVMLPPSHGQKERRYGHLLAGEPKVVDVQAGSSSAMPSSKAEELEESIVSLREELATLRSEFDALKADLLGSGDSD